ncbi:MAG: GyrI-like domain-containing protein [Thermoflexales bacterium]|nr:GyrI-like domain-containing protein [Thermoflexales bacterium]
MTNAELAILGLVGEQPRHGYEIEQVIEERGMRDWTEIGFSSIYYLLKKLEQKGLVESRLEEAERGAARRVYRITPAGTAALRAGLYDALSIPHPHFSSLLLGLSNLPAFSSTETATALRQYQASLAADLERLQVKWDSQRPLPYFVDALFDYSITVIQAELDWIERFIKHMEEQMPAVTMSKPIITTIDFKKELKHLYNPSSKAFVVVDVPPMQFLMIDGHGNPNTAQEYQDAIGALYTVAYTLKFMSKKTLGKDYVVPPPEGLWWAEDMEAFTRGDKDSWDWTMMIMQPDWISPAMVEQAVEQAKKKGLPALSKLRLESYHEGLSVQIMHIGPFANEGPTLHKLHLEFIPQGGYQTNGKHHEIYLSDPRRTAPEKLKTVLRQPVKKA